MVRIDFGCLMACESGTNDEFLRSSSLENLTMFWWNHARGHGVISSFSGDDHFCIVKLGQVPYKLKV